MLTLTFGYEKPETSDLGTDFFPAMERNIQRMNDHNHDGASSAFLSAITQELDSADWAAPSNGVYSQVVTLPTDILFDAVDISFRLDTGVPIQLSVLKLTDSTYRVYINDNTQTITALYTS